MNGRKKEPWRRPPKNPWRPPSSESDDLWPEEPPKTSPGCPRNDRRPDASKTIGPSTKAHRIQPGGLNISIGEIGNGVDRK
jgi:hypothetical protein